jgi:hypothetical protein
VIVRQSPRITLEFPDLYHASDFPELLHADEPANGNEATVTAMDGTLVKFVKVDGVWKCDVTPSIPLDTAYFQAATKKNALVQQLTAEINSGKYTSYQEVEEAIEAVLPRSHGELVPGAFGGFR